MNQRLRQQRLKEEQARMEACMSSEEVNPCCVPATSTSAPSSPFSISFVSSSSLESPPPSPTFNIYGAERERQKLDELREGGFIMDEEYKHRMAELTS
eukprot:TRINITY_DN13053_c0_g1_i1.p1 TRINITY_DN13053_c0_g1~~TRINITY_DN13053_c0_g1_i1.p1  ORF type:complete len:108 (+),score=13.46 TRINITY_DN13053_c0_g1_i1:33-326(+)